MRLEIKNRLLVSLGFLSVALGFVGIFLPLLPTTPFLILAAIFFSKGSPKWHQWLRDHKTLGPSLRDWEDYRRIKFATKVYVTFLILLSAGLMYKFAVVPMGLKYAIFGLLLAVSLFIWTRKSK